MAVTRRGFLQSLMAATASALAYDVDPERLLWVPGQKTIFLPPAKPTQIVTATEIPSNVSLVGERTVHTAMGRAVFDAHWNLLKLGSRKITSAYDAAMLQHNAYQGRWKQPPVDLVSRVAAARAAAGLRDSVTRADLEGSRHVF